MIMVNNRPCDVRFLHLFMWRDWRIVSGIRRQAFPIAGVVVVVVVLVVVVVYRREIWEDNVAYIRSHNLLYDMGHKSFTLGLNRYADLVSKNILTVLIYTVLLQYQIRLLNGWHARNMFYQGVYNSSVLRSTCICCNTGLFYGVPVYAATLDWPRYFNWLYNITGCCIRSAPFRWQWHQRWRLYKRRSRGRTVGNHRSSEDALVIVRTVRCCLRNVSFDVTDQQPSSLLQKWEWPHSHRGAGGYWV